MSLRKKIFAILLIGFTLISIFIFSLFPSLFLDNPSGKYKSEIKIKSNFLKNESKPIVMLFFGYTDCSYICIPALEELSDIYDQLDKQKIAFYFINLQHLTDPQIVDSYAKNFNKDFKGIYLSHDKILEVTSELKVKYFPSTLNHHVIDHSGFLHLLIKDKDKYSQKYIYTTRPFNKDYIVKDIKNIQGVLND